MLNAKQLLLTVCALCITSMLSAQTTLKEGSEIRSYPTVEWLKGEPVTQLDPDKVYLIECWATWCGPCKMAIPHVNELHNKYADKGLVVIGQDVFEDKIDVVKAFVAEKGDEMAYRVAYSGGRDSQFVKDWVEPIGIKGIPHTTIIKNNRIVWMTHPMNVSEKAIEYILATPNPVSADIPK